MRRSGGTLGRSRQARLARRPVFIAYIMSRRCALRLRLALRRCPPLVLRLALRRPPLHLPCAIAAKCSTRSMTRLARRPRCPPLTSCRGLVLYAFGLHTPVSTAQRFVSAVSTVTPGTARNSGLKMASTGRFYPGAKDNSEDALLPVTEPPSGSFNGVSTRERGKEANFPHGARRKFV